MHEAQARQRTRLQAIQVKVRRLRDIYCTASTSSICGAAAVLCSFAASARPMAIGLQAAGLVLHCSPCMTNACMIPMEMYTPDPPPPPPQANAEASSRQHLVHLLNHRAPGGNVALAWLHHNLLAHSDGGLPERDVGEGSPHGASSHLQLQLHAAYEALLLGAEVALLKGGAVLLHQQCSGNREDSAKHDSVQYDP